MAKKLLGNRSTGLVFIISAPAGTGKTTLVRMLMKEFCCVAESVSYTTRSPRAGELDGKDYYFISPALFKEKIKNQEFLEYAEVFGNYYGTSKKHVEEQVSQGKHVVLVIDTQGAMKLKKEGFKATFVFLQPPSFNALKDRLQKRKTESDEIIQERLSWAKEELEMAKFYDYLIVNDSLEMAYQILRSVMIAEDHRIRNK